MAANSSNAEGKEIEIIHESRIRKNNHFLLEFAVKTLQHWTLDKEEEEEAEDDDDNSGNDNGNDDNDDDEDEEKKRSSPLKASLVNATRYFGSS